MWKREKNVWSDWKFSNFLWNWVRFLKNSNNSKKTFDLIGNFSKFSLKFWAIFENLEKKQKKKRNVWSDWKFSKFCLKFRAIFENLERKQKKKSLIWLEIFKIFFEILGDFWKFWKRAKKMFDFPTFVPSRPFFRRPVLTSKKKQYNFEVWHLNLFLFQKRLKRRFWN